MVQPQEACGVGHHSVAWTEAVLRQGGSTMMGFLPGRAGQAVGREPAERLAGQVEQFSPLD